MKKETIAAAAAAIALSGAAGAHEFVCEKTIEGEVLHVVDSYPATLHFRIIVTNTHPTDASTALWVRDDALAKFLPAAPSPSRRDGRWSSTQRSPSVAKPNA